MPTRSPSRSVSRFDEDEYYKGDPKTSYLPRREPDKPWSGAKVRNKHAKHKEPTKLHAVIAPKGQGPQKKKYGFELEIPKCKNTTLTSPAAEERARQKNQQRARQEMEQARRAMEQEMEQEMYQGMEQRAHSPERAERPQAVPRASYNAQYHDDGGYAGDREELYGRDQPPHQEFDRPRPSTQRHSRHSSAAPPGNNYPSSGRSSSHGNRYDDAVHHGYPSDEERLYGNTQPDHYSHHPYSPSQGHSQHSSAATSVSDYDFDASDATSCDSSPPIRQHSRAARQRFHTPSNDSSRQSHHSSVTDSNRVPLLLGDEDRYVNRKTTMVLHGRSSSHR